MNILKASSLILIFVIAGELGFQARAFIKRHHLPDIHGDLKILVIGDSVIGSTGETGSVYDELQKKLQATYGNKVSLIDGTSKANFTGQANFLADDLLKKYNPQLSIVLLGGSDYVNPSIKTENKFRNSVNYVKNIFYQTYLFKFIMSLRQQKHYVDEKILKRFDVIRHVSKSSQSMEKYNQLLAQKNISCLDKSKLAELSAIFHPEQAVPYLEDGMKCYPQMKKSDKPFEAAFYIGKAWRELNQFDQSVAWFEKSLKDNPRTESVYSILFWIKYTQKDCKSMFKYFELTMEKTEPNRRMIWQMRNCFVVQKREADGVKYFNRLAGKFVTNKNLSLMMAQSLNTDKGDEFLKAVNPEGNDYYLSLLLYYKINNRVQDANELYLEKDLYIGSEETVIDTKNFRELLEKLTRNNGRVLVLQYPNLPDWTVLEAIAPFKENVSFLSLSGVFKKNLKEHSILDLLSEDFIHVSQIGAQVIADELTVKINQMKKD